MCTVKWFVIVLILVNKPGNVFSMCFWLRRSSWTSYLLVLWIVERAPISLYRWIVIGIQLELVFFWILGHLYLPSSVYYLIALFFQNCTVRAFSLLVHQFLWCNYISNIFKKMPCSAVTLSLATIATIIATALIAIAFSTDNWLYIDVNRANVKVCMWCILLNDIL